MAPIPLVVDGTSVPGILYGTAWKEQRTRELTLLALSQGFRGIDTANQRKHYVESQVGEAVRAVLDTGQVVRDELFLQTKFTFRAGQDQRLPYDEKAPVADQVRQSFASSLEHLGVERIDSYVLHGPSGHEGLGPADFAAWQAMEELHASGKARFLGISNVSVDQLQQLLKRVRVRPGFVQNRCFAVTGWDQQMRHLCTSEGIVYQAFSLLTANASLLTTGAAASIAARHDKTIPQVIFRFALQNGLLPLTGTTSARHMQDDLAIGDFQLDEEELRHIEQLGTRAAGGS